MKAPTFYVFIFTEAGARNFGNNRVFFITAKRAKITAIALSETVIERTVIPIGDKPKNKPDMPAMLKLKATDNTTFSTRSSFSS